MPAPSKAERVDYITERMAAGEWRAGLSTQEMAHKWGLHYQSVSEDAGEAARRLRLGPERLEELQQTWLAFIERVMHDAMARKNKATNLPDYKAALQATEMAFKYAIGEQRNNAGPKPEDLSDEELRELASKAMAFAAKRIAPSTESKNERTSEAEGADGT